MSNTVNLKQARKEKTRSEKRAQGDANALKFGQSKSDKQKALAEMKLAQARFQAHKIDRSDGQA